MCCSWLAVERMTSWNVLQTKYFDKLYCPKSLISERGQLFLPVRNNGILAGEKCRAAELKRLVTIPTVCIFHCIPIYRPGRR